jgi:2-polyprenyl-3-methyl-5-hydroxy-6-metoxy-1,4-benzoquinol methylase
MTDPKVPHKIVFKVEEGMDPEEILCTTYQMRDMYSQLGTGFFSSLDIMNYIQHHAAIQGVRSGDRVLDVCCGRALLLPLLRFYKPQIAHYIGVDIEPKNWSPALTTAAMTKIKGSRFAKNSPGNEEPFYPFAVSFIESNVAIMSQALNAQGIKSVDYIVYTASIEHMQKSAGVQSLVECFELLKPDGRMFISTPNTEGDPYDTQYAAHLYEWSLDELRQTLKQVGFIIDEEFGLTAKGRTYEDRLEESYPQYLQVFHDLKQYLPREWLYSIMPILTPSIADEVALKCRKPQ